MVKGCALFKNFVICCVLNPISSHWHLDPLFLCRGSSLTETLSGRWQTFLYLIFGPCIHFNNSIHHCNRSAFLVFFMAMDYLHPHTHIIIELTSHIICHGELTLMDNISRSSLDNHKIMFNGLKMIIKLFHYQYRLYQSIRPNAGDSS